MSAGRAGRKTNMQIGTVSQGDCWMLTKQEFDLRPIFKWFTYHKRSRFEMHIRMGPLFIYGRVLVNYTAVKMNVYWHAHSFRSSFLLNSHKTGRCHARHSRLTGSTWSREINNGLFRVAAKAGLIQWILQEYRVKRCKIKLRSVSNVCDSNLYLKYWRNKRR